MTDAIRAVLFDLDDTLLRYRRSSAALLEESFEAVGVEPVFPVEAYYDQFRRFADETDSVAELRRECFAALCADRGRDPDLGRRVAAVYADERDHRDVEWVAGAHEVVDSFSERYRLGVVTNSPADSARRKIDAAGVDDYAETVVFAGHDTPAKPAAEPFHRALDALGVDPGSAVHVGDSIRSDVAGANAAGLRSVLYAPDGTGDGVADGSGGDRDVPDHRVAALSELRSPPWSGS
ncbi:HAD family hydrolase [Halobellus ruber]|uniref:HAD family hydrolase n=1 Tax=Halobellus ruber TaxID=2761102 RepID=A0A7J9SDM8_9EURY|nr:HAD family hydrolase [Halobellus ruber]MBB6645025.1 HAD family hydrolase [Halobellus ruber]